MKRFFLSLGALCLILVVNAQDIAKTINDYE